MIVIRDGAHPLRGGGDADRVEHVVTPIARLYRFSLCLSIRNRYEPQNPLRNPDGAGDDLRGARHGQLG